ncbi:MAG TPA: spore coat U domain-containing protein [Candidatus Rubrimentiphilum sp.]|nr:spore coat U domain-containing protein [Candidatus Rubrimentiphilum sp.]
MKQLAPILIASMFAVALMGADSTSKSTLTVKTAVAANCALQSPQGIDFGTYDPSSNGTVDAQVDALQIQCTKGSAGVSIALDNGQYYNGTHRTMRTAGGNGAVFYEIYTAAARSVVWNRTQTVTYVAATSQPVKITLYGRVLGATAATPGDYSDTLTALVNF